ncbi:MAG: cytidylate kinase family protein [Candidatus Altiarchaeota archaeon]|nr:cytidylate kinase family protein [Candidatus Altiarchaeota archaeon]
MIITVGGSAASGKTTLAKNLAKRLGFRHISAGGIMRDMAAEQGKDLIEFSKYAEKHHEIDLEIDRRQKILAKGNIVVDGRLSAHFLNAGLRIWLTAPLEVRARRIWRRDGFKTLKDAMAHITRREESERRRYRRIYSINHPDLGIYDLILCTERFGVEETTDIAAAAAKCLL